MGGPGGQEKQQQPLTQIFRLADCQLSIFRLADKDRGKCFGGVARLATAVNIDVEDDDDSVNPPLPYSRH